MEVAGSAPCCSRVALRAAGSWASHDLWVAAAAVVDQLEPSRSGSM